MRLLLLLVFLALPVIAWALEAAPPAGPLPPALRQSLLSDMRSAIAAGQPATARLYAARLLWQLEPTSEGLPLQIYVFTTDTRWAVYEGVQADIFDHLLSIIPEFGLRVFQRPSGHDFLPASNEEGLVVIPTRSG